jgi:hypothetical protein
VTRPWTGPCEKDVRFFDFLPHFSRFFQIVIFPRFFVIFPPFFTIFAHFPLFSFSHLFQLVGIVGYRLKVSKKVSGIIIHLHSSDGLWFPPQPKKTEEVGEVEKRWKKSESEGKKYKLPLPPNQQALPSGGGFLGFLEERGFVFCSLFASHSLAVTQ